MDRLVRLFHGGEVKDDGQFEKMKEKMLIFNSPPNFEDVVSRMHSVLAVGVGEDIVNVRGRFDCGKRRPHYVMMTISSEGEWSAYKEAVKDSNVSCLELVAEVHIPEADGEDQLKAVKLEKVVEKTHCTHGDEAERPDVLKRIKLEKYVDETHIGHGPVSMGDKAKGACYALHQEFDTVQDFGVFGHHDNFERALASDSLVQLDGEDDEDNIALGSKEEDAVNEEGGKAEYVVGVGIDDEGTGGRDEDASGEENMVVDLAIQGKDFEKPRMISWFDVTQSISEKDRIMADSVGVDLPTVHFYQDVSQRVTPFHR